MSITAHRVTTVHVGIPMEQGILPAPIHCNRHARQIPLRPVERLDIDPKSSGRCSTPVNIRFLGLLENITSELRLFGFLYVDFFPRTNFYLATAITGRSSDKQGYPTCIIYGQK